jgi:hypothetical protein
MGGKIVFIWARKRCDSHSNNWCSFRLKFYIKSLSRETVDNEFSKKKQVSDKCTIWRKLS